MQFYEKADNFRIKFRLAIFAIAVALLANNSVAATRPSLSETERTLAKKYEPLLLDLAIDEDKMQEIRAKLAGLSKPEILEFMQAMKPWLLGHYDQHQRVILSFNVLRKNKAFDKDAAIQMLNLLKEARVGWPIERTKSIDSIVEKRMYLFLAVKAGQFDANRINAELKMIADPKRDSVERVGMAGALVDAMVEAGGMKPTAEQLERLLKNDISTIRILAVDWFGFAPPRAVEERTRFLKIALKTNPRQVFESAQRACAADTSSVIREMCAKAKVAADSP